MYLLVYLQEVGQKGCGEWLCKKIAKHAI